MPRLDLQYLRTRLCYLIHDEHILYLGYEEKLLHPSASMAMPCVDISSDLEIISNLTVRDCKLNGYKLHPLELAELFDMDLELYHNENIIQFVTYEGYKFELINGHGWRLLETIK